MPAPNMPGNTGTGRRTCDDPVTDEAARFLDRPLLEPNTEFGNPGEMIVARIRGIDFLERIGTWQAVERDLGRDDGEPRERVMTWLRDRAGYLREHGDRDVRATGDRDPAPEKTVTIPERPSIPLSPRPFTDLSAYQNEGDQLVATDGGPHAADPENTSTTGVRPLAIECRQSSPESSETVVTTACPYCRTPIDEQESLADHLRSGCDGIGGGQ